MQRAFERYTVGESFFSSFSFGKIININRETMFDQTSVFILTNATVGKRYLVVSIEKGKYVVRSRYGKKRSFFL